MAPFLRILVVFIMTATAISSARADRLFNFVPDNPSVAPLSAGTVPPQETNTITGKTRYVGSGNDTAIYSGVLFARSQSDKAGEMSTFAVGTNFFRVNKLARYNNESTFGAIIWDFDLADAKTKYKDLALDLKFSSARKEGAYYVYISYTDPRAGLVRDTSLSFASGANGWSVYKTVTDITKYKKMAKLNLTEKQELVLSGLDLDDVVGAGHDGKLRIVIAGYALNDNLSVSRDESQIKGTPIPFP